MRCNAYTFKDSGLDFKDMECTDYNLDKEYMVDIKSRWGLCTFKAKGEFVPDGDGIEIKFLSHSDRYYYLYNPNRIIKLYFPCKAKEDKPLFDNKKVQMYARYKKCICK